LATLIVLTLLDRSSHTVLLYFRQEDISQHLVETSTSPWLLEADYDANDCC